MANKLPNIKLQWNYWTWWRITIEVLKFVIFTGMEVLVFLLLYIELLAVLRGTGFHFSIPTHIMMF